jgi:hypothetical protein
MRRRTTAVSSIWSCFTETKIKIQVAKMKSGRNQDKFICVDLRTEKQVYKTRKFFNVDTNAYIFCATFRVSLSFALSRGSQWLRSSARALFVIRQIPSLHVGRAIADGEESRVDFAARFSSGDFNRTLVSCRKCRKGNLLSTAFWKRVEISLLHC